jgi:hypothetical protein
VGVLTETTMRLREQVVAWRQVRAALRGDLVRQTGERRARVSVLCAGFARDRADARRAWFGPALSGRLAAERPPRQPAERPPVTPLPQAHKPPLKKSKKR